MRASSIALAVHAARVWRGGQLRFRLETFGLYYPTLPYASPWWKISGGNLIALLQQGPAYARWVLELEGIRSRGAIGWWQRQRGAPTARTIEAVIDAWNAPE